MHLQPPGARRQQFARSLGGEAGQALVGRQLAQQLLKDLKGQPGHGLLLAAAIVVLGAGEAGQLVGDLGA